jgi:hemolysin activation/secretion protein
VDFGVAWNDDDNPIPTPAPNTLTSVGLGLQWQMGDNFTARFDWAVPLTDIENEGGRSPEESFNFTINYSFF